METINLIAKAKVIETPQIETTQQESFSLAEVQKMVEEKISLDHLRFSVCCSDSTASL